MSWLYSTIITGAGLVDRSRHPRSHRWTVATRGKWKLDIAFVLPMSRHATASSPSVLMRHSISPTCNKQKSDKINKISHHSNNISTTCVTYLHASEVQFRRESTVTASRPAQVVMILFAPSQHVDGHEKVIRVDVDAGHVKLIKHLPHHGRNCGSIAQVTTEICHVSCVDKHVTNECVE